MSAGTSSSSGTENSNQNSTGTRTGTSTQNTNQQTTFDNSSTSQTKVPLWARQANQTIFNERAGAEGDAVDFLSALLKSPLSSDDTDNRFSRAIDNRFQTELTRARSGDAQSVGVGKQAQREAAALTDANTAALGTGAAAANSLLTNASAYQPLDFARLIAPNTQQSTGSANTTGLNTTNTDEQTTGTQQSNTSMQGSNGGYGVTVCCFIFLESYHGAMPDYVRRCRDEFCSGRRVSGYRRMATWLVPAMRRSMLVSGFVWALMVWPITKFGGWLYDRNRWGWIMTPFVVFWFGLWAATQPKEAKE